MKIISALISGLIFGLGLSVSMMASPEKVLGFLDFFGAWDASLAFVMGGALVTYGIGYRLIIKRPHPLFASEFKIPTKKDIDSNLVMGSIMFGVGWGMVGYCPGPAITALGWGFALTGVFVVSMLTGMVGHKIAVKNKVI